MSGSLFDFLLSKPIISEMSRQLGHEQRTILAYVQILACVMVN